MLTEEKGEEAVAQPKVQEASGSFSPPSRRPDSSNVSPAAQSSAPPDEVKSAAPPAEAVTIPPGTVAVEAPDAPAAGYVAQIAGRVAEMETVQKGMQYVADKSKQVAENEKVQQGVEFVMKKGTQIAESESVQKGIAIAQDAAKVVGEKTASGIEVAKGTAKAVGEKTAQGIEVAKEKTKAMAENAASVWQKGRGSISRVKDKVTNRLAWQGSARDTLKVAEMEAEFTNMVVQGACEMQIRARQAHTSTYHVKKGSTLRWSFRVKDYDIGFGVSMRVQEWGGSREEEVLPVERYDCADTVSGSWTADEDRTMVMVLDNRHSKLRPKTVAYFVGTEKPSISIDDPTSREPAEENQAASSSSPARAPPAQRPARDEANLPVAKPIV